MDWAFLRFKIPTNLHYSQTLDTSYTDTLSLRYLQIYTILKPMLCRLYQFQCLRYLQIYTILKPTVNHIFTFPRLRYLQIYTILKQH